MVTFGFSKQALVMVLKWKICPYYHVSQEALDDLKGKWRVIGLVSFFLFVSSALLMCLGVVVYMFKVEGLL